MNDGWWQNIINKKIKKERGRKNELWRIWWTICATTIKRKT